MREGNDKKRVEYISTSLLRDGCYEANYGVKFDIERLLMRPWNVTWTPRANLPSRAGVCFTFFREYILRKFG